MNGEVKRLLTSSDVKCDIWNFPLISLVEDVPQFILGANKDLRVRFSNMSGLDMTPLLIDNLKSISRRITAMEVSFFNLNDLPKAKTV